MWLRVWMSMGGRVWVEEDEYIRVLGRMVGVDEMAVIFLVHSSLKFPAQICNLLLIYTILTSDSWKGSIVWLPHVN